MKRKPNLLLIAIDSLRADHLSCLGYSKRVSPHIDQFASEGTLFTQVIANGPRSPDSFPSILASTYQSANGKRGLPQAATTLAEVLKKHGYVTAGFCAGNPYVSRYCGYQKGFDLFQDFLNREPTTPASRENRNKPPSPLRKLTDRILGDKRHDSAFLLFSSTLRGRKNIADTTKSKDAYPFESGKELNKHVKAWLSHLSGDPFFLWIHYMDVHFPHLPRVPRHRLSDYGRFALALICLLLKLWSYPRQVMINLYDDRIRDEDEIIAQLLTHLRDLEFYKDTIIILTADHGDEFQEHGGWGHAAKLYDELLRVPVIMRGPELAQGTIITRQIGLIDLAPTILDLLGIKEHVESFQGISFLPLLRGKSEPENQYVFSEAVHLGERLPPFWNQDDKGKKLYRIRSCRSEDWKYIWDEEGDQQELYNLRLDPKETKNLADSKPEVVKRFRTMTREHFSELASVEMATDGATQSVLSPQEETLIAHRLRDLGYF